MYMCILYVCMYVCKHLQDGFELVQVVRVSDQFIGELIEIRLEGDHVGLGDVMQQFAEQYDPLVCLLS